MPTEYLLPRIWVLSRGCSLQRVSFKRGGLYIGLTAPVNRTDPVAKTAVSTCTCTVLLKPCFQVALSHFQFADPVATPEMQLDPELLSRLQTLASGSGPEDHVLIPVGAVYYSQQCKTLCILYADDASTPSFR